MSAHYLPSWTITVIILILLMKQFALHHSRTTSKKCWYHFCLGQKEAPEHCRDYCCRQWTASVPTCFTATTTWEYTWHEVADGADVVRPLVFWLWQWFAKLNSQSEQCHWDRVHPRLQSFWTTWTKSCTVKPQPACTFPWPTDPWHPSCETTLHNCISQFINKMN